MALPGAGHSNGTALCDLSLWLIPQPPATFPSSGPSFWDAAAEVSPPGDASCCPSPTGVMVSVSVLSQLSHCSVSLLLIKFHNFSNPNLLLASAPRQRGFSLPSMWLPT